MITKKTLQAELKKEGLSDYQFDKFKLYNPEAFDKFTSQAKYSIKEAVEVFKYRIKRG